MQVTSAWVNINVTNCFEFVITAITKHFHCMQPDKHGWITTHHMTRTANITYWSMSSRKLSRLDQEVLDFPGSLVTLVNQADPRCPGSPADRRLSADRGGRGASRQADRPLRMSARPWRCWPGHRGPSRRRQTGTEGCSGRPAPVLTKLRTRLHVLSTSRHWEVEYHKVFVKSWRCEGKHM